MKKTITFETVDQFLARGNQIQKVNYRYAYAKNQEFVRTSKKPKEEEYTAFSKNSLHARREQDVIKRRREIALDEMISV